MKQEILKLVNLIKDDLRDMEEDGVYHSLIDNIWESLAGIEDEIYEDDSNETDGLDISDYMD
jgi:hypothetical protein